MKKINYLIGIVLLPFLFSACESLDTEPTDRIIDGYFWKTEADAIMAVNGIYRTLPGTDYMYLDCATDLAWNEISWEKAHLLGNGSQDAELWSWTSDKWKTAYETIQRANYFMENIDRVQALSPELKNRLCAEARFLRAMTYADIIFLWGDVPLLTATVDLKTAQLPRTPKAQIFDYVVSELKEIADFLPEKYDAANVGRITKGAAKAMLMRTYLRENRFEEAKAAAKEVMDMGIYSLYPDYEKLFKYAGENCSEVILDKQYIATTYSNNLSQIFSPRSCYGNGSIVPLKGLVDAYEMRNGKAITDRESGYDPYHPYENRDPRLKATILTPGATMPDGNVFNPLPNQDPVGTDAVDNGNTNTSRTGFNFLKYVNPEDLTESNKNCHNNIILIRYAEVLLSYAEAKVETNDIDASVYEAINAVRRRAGMPEFTEGKSQSQLREIIRQERKVEFPLDGLRYFDIRRWKIADQVLPGQTYGMTYVDAKGELVTIKTEVRKFNPERDYLWPVPLREMNVNKKLTQNPNY